VEPVRPFAEDIEQQIYLAGGSFPEGHNINPARAGRVRRLYELSLLYKKKRQQKLLARKHTENF
jgi:hypothetical protein